MVTTMVLTRTLAGLVLSGLLVTACGGAGGGAGGALTLEQYGARAQDVICAIEIQCGSVPDKSSCLTFVDLGQAKADVASGKTIFDGAAGATCLDALEGRDCSRSGLIVQPPSCLLVATGTIADGGPCSTGTQCVSRSCTLTPNDCDRDTTCCAGTCAPALVTIAEGGACAGTTNAVCGTGLFCDATAAAPTCVKRRTLGATCTSLTQCLESLRCARAQGAAEGTCATYPKRGQPCTDDIFSCDDALDFCDPTSKTCRARLAVGADCTAAPMGCLSLATCDATSHTCVMRAAAGQPCTDDDECLGRLVCPSGVCAVPKPRAVCP